MKNTKVCLSKVVKNYEVFFDDFGIHNLRLCIFIFAKFHRSCYKYEVFISATYGSLVKGE